MKSQGKLRKSFASSELVEEEKFLKELLDQFITIMKATLVK
jgi:hypothetical protein